MKHFTIYHDQDERGDVPKRTVYRAYTRTRFTEERVKSDVLDSRVWLIMGHGGRPRRYSLCYWFTVDRFVFAPSPEEEHLVSGAEGQQFLPPLPIEAEEWFGDLKATQFFSRGLAEIKDPRVIEGLMALASAGNGAGSEEDSEEVFDEMDVEDQLAAEIAQSLSLTAAERAARLAEAPRLPEQVAVVKLVFRRNADVIVEVLKRANGVCELCGQGAPFLRRTDGSPYLEVHHWDRLCDGGEDTVENAAALCPNCHREEHLG